MHKSIFPLQCLLKAFFLSLYIFSTSMNYNFFHSLASNSNLVVAGCNISVKNIFLQHPCGFYISQIWLQFSAQSGESKELEEWIILTWKMRILKLLVRYKVKILRDMMMIENWRVLEDIRRRNRKYCGLNENFNILWKELAFRAFKENEIFFKKYPVLKLSFYKLSKIELLKK